MKATRTAARSPVTGPGALVVAGTLVAVTGGVVGAAVAVSEVTGAVVCGDRGTIVLLIAIFDPLCTVMDSVIVW